MKRKAVKLHQWFAIDLKQKDENGLDLYVEKFVTTTLSTNEKNTTYILTALAPDGNGREFELTKEEYDKYCPMGTVYSDYSCDYIYKTDIDWNKVYTWKDEDIPF